MNFFYLAYVRHSCISHLILTSPSLITVISQKSNIAPLSMPSMFNKLISESKLLLNSTSFSK